MKPRKLTRIETALIAGASDGFRLTPNAAAAIVRARMKTRAGSKSENHYAIANHACKRLVKLGLLILHDAQYDSLGRLIAKGSHWYGLTESTKRPHPWKRNRIGRSLPDDLTTVDTTDYERTQWDEQYQ
jgi:hypothetical protein